MLSWPCDRRCSHADAAGQKYSINNDPPRWDQRKDLANGPEAHQSWPNTWAVFLQARSTKPAEKLSAQNNHVWKLRPEGMAIMGSTSRNWLGAKDQADDMQGKFIFLQFNFFN